MVSWASCSWGSASEKKLRLDDQEANLLHCHFHLPISWTLLTLNASWKAWGGQVFGGISTRLVVFSIKEGHFHHPGTGSSLTKPFSTFFWGSQSLVRIDNIHIRGVYQETRGHLQLVITDGDNPNYALGPIKSFLFVGSFTFQVGTISKMITNQELHWKAKILLPKVFTNLSN